MNTTINLIVAKDLNNGIGNDNKMSWYLPNELAHFKNLTLNCTILMGYNTWESLPIKPLKNRNNIIISENHYDELKKQNYDENQVNIFKNIQEALKYLEENNIEKIFVIGGETIYNEFIANNFYDNLYTTNIYCQFNCTKYFNMPNNLQLTEYGNVETEIDKNSGNLVHYQYFIYENQNSIKNTSFSMDKIMSNNSRGRNPQEKAYLDLMKKIIDFGTQRNTRNGKTIGLFGEKLEFDISEYFPLLTTKKTFLRGIFEELKFFILGKTDNEELLSKGVKIWVGNTTKEYLENYGIDLQENDLGPCYGFQWRHWNANYTNCKENYEGNGIDQLANIIEEIKNNPESRRLVITAYNPEQLNKGCIYPCHILFQFYVRDEYLDIQMYQRSADYMLGVPFNIASYALLCYIIANICNLKAGKLIMNFGDIHIYEEHLDAVKIQLARLPYSPPKLEINKKINSLADVENLNFEDIEIKNYSSYPTIKMQMIA